MDVSTLFLILAGIQLFTLERTFTFGNKLSSLFTDVGYIKRWIQKQEATNVANRKIRDLPANPPGNFHGSGDNGQ